MPVKFIINHVQWPFAAFSIDFSLFFIRLEPVPQLFDETLKPMLVANFDFWFQAKTQQRYSFRGFCDMVEAFQAGMAVGFSLDDVKEVVANTTFLTKIAVLERLGAYRKHFWVEMLNPVKLEEVQAPQVRERFEELRQKLGDDGLYNYLCRLWKFSTNHRPSMTPVFEKLIGRLGRLPNDPVYPSPHQLDSELNSLVMARVVEHHIVEYKNVAPAAIEGLKALTGQ